MSLKILTAGYRTLNPTDFKLVNSYMPLDKFYVLSFLQRKSQCLKYNVCLLQRVQSTQQAHGFSSIHCGKIPFPKEQVNLKMTIISQVVMSHSFNPRRQRLVNLSARPVLSTQKSCIKTKSPSILGFKFFSFTLDPVSYNFKKLKRGKNVKGKTTRFGDIYVMTKQAEAEGPS